MLGPGDDIHRLLYQQHLEQGPVAPSGPLVGPPGKTLPAGMCPHCGGGGGNRSRNSSSTWLPPPNLAVGAHAMRVMGQGHVAGGQTDLEGGFAIADPIAHLALVLPYDAHIGETLQSSCTDQSCIHSVMDDHLRRVGAGAYHEVGEPLIQGRSESAESSEWVTPETADEKAALEAVQRDSRCYCHMEKRSGTLIRRQITVLWWVRWGDKRVFTPAGPFGGRDGYGGKGGLGNAHTHAST